MMTTTHDEENNNNGKQKNSHSGQKRKTTEEVNPTEEGEADIKRRRNREAAKKCRERKMQETENLRKKNEELEMDNCKLVKQRDDLRQRCNTLEEMLKQHKQQGCVISEFSSSCSDLSHIFDSSISTSPSFAGPQSLGLNASQSPASSFNHCSTSSPGYSLQTDVMNPLPRQYSCPSAANSPVTNQNVNTQVGSSPATLIETREMRAESRTIPPDSQQTNVSVQEYPHQIHTILVKDEDGRPKKLRLSHEEYIRVMEKIQASPKASAKLHQRQSAVLVADHDSLQSPASAKQHHTQTVVSNVDHGSVPQPYQMSSALQASQLILSELSDDVDQCVNSQFRAKISMQNYYQNAPFSSNNDLMSVIDISDDNSRNDYVLVNPNDVFMKKEELDTIKCDQNSFGSSVAVQHKDNHVQPCTSQQMFSEQMTKLGTHVLIDPDEQSVCAFQSENVNRLSNDQTCTVTISDSRTAQVLGQTPTLNNHAAKKLPLSATKKSVMAESMSGQKKQIMSYAMSPANPAILPLSSITSSSSHDVPFLYCVDEPGCLKKPVSVSPSEVHIDAVTENQQSSSDFMNTIKLRPKVLNAKSPSGSRIQIGNTTVSSQNAVMSTQPHQFGILTSLAAKDSYLIPFEDSQTINQSAGFQLTTVDTLPICQKNSTHNDVPQLILQQQMVSPMPIVSVSQFSSPDVTQGSQTKNNTSAPREEQVSHMTESKRNVMEYLAALFTTETLDTA